MVSNELQNTWSKDKIEEAHTFRFRQWDLETYATNLRLADRAIILCVFVCVCVK